MRKRKKTFIADLTPLLDVVFILLFLVMMVTTRSQAERTQQAEAAAEEAVADAREARREADDALARAAELETLLKDARVAEVSLSDTEDGGRRLTVTDGSETSSYAFDWEGVEEARAFLQRELARVVRSAPADAPVFLIFRYDPAGVYESDYRLVTGVFDAIQKINDNVYLQIREGQHE